VRLIGLLICLMLLWLGDLLATLTWPLRAIARPHSPRTKELLRLMDHKTNVAWFGGDWWGSLSAQSWQVRRWWLIRALDYVERGHCEGAFKREMDVIDFFKRRGA
jgi:hypothetical protein